jgi:hypothetical protein
MKKLILAGMCALTVFSVSPAIGQPVSNGGWDREAFWRDAPRSTYERIDFMQSRIDRGASDGSLDRQEARQLQRQLNRIRQDARRMGRLNDRESAQLQGRLDDLGQRIRWRRIDSAYGSNGRAYPADDRQFATDYDATRYYRDDPRYEERRLSSQDEVYRGSDGRYYCKRNDGTTGLIIGAAGGGVLGNVLDGGRNRVAGTLIGGALGALAGKSIDQNSDVRCR